MAIETASKVDTFCNFILFAVALVAAGVIPVLPAAANKIQIN
jgi:hypothetical protein